MTLSTKRPEKSVLICVLVITNGFISEHEKYEIALHALEELKRLVSCDASLRKYASLLQYRHESHFYSLQPNGDSKQVSSCVVPVPDSAALVYYLIVGYNLPIWGWINSSIANFGAHPP